MVSAVQRTAARPAAGRCWCPRCSNQATVQVTTTLKSSNSPVLADVYGCGTDVLGYLLVVLRRNEPAQLRLSQSFIRCSRGGNIGQCTVLLGPCIAALKAVTRNESGSYRGWDPQTPECGSELTRLARDQRDQRSATT